MTIANVALRFVRSVLPVAMLYIGKLIIDEVIFVAGAGHDFEGIRHAGSDRWVKDLTRGKTAVLISHRFSTVRMADRILVLNDGELEEIGTHEQLLAARGRYAELFELQAEGYR
jgi:ATP-binding cassette subfamily B protein